MPARLVIGGKYGKDIVFVGNARFLPAPVAKVVRDYFGRWNTLADITRFPQLLTDLGDARAHRHFADTDWEALDAHYRAHMQKYALVFKGEVVGGKTTFAVGCPHGAPAKPLLAVLQAWCEPGGALRDRFDLWRVDKLLRRGKAQVKYTPGFAEALRVFGATAVSFEESLSFFRQVQAYHDPRFLKPELAALLAQYIDKVHTLRDPLLLDELVAKLREAGASVRVDRTVEGVVQHAKRLEEERGRLLGTEGGAPESTLQDRGRSRPHRGFYKRRYLPHFDNPTTLQFVTFRLGDSLPRHQLEALLDSNLKDDAVLAKVTEWLDAGYGNCWLGKAEIAELVQEALLHFDGERYAALAWVVMPNHVHVVIAPKDGHQLAAIVKSWKGFTSRKANELLGRKGRFWMPDYFDRGIRNENDLANVIAYIHNNPVKAGLASSPEEFRWSSAAGFNALEVMAAVADVDVRGPEEESADQSSPLHAGSPLDSIITTSQLYPFQREGVAFLVTNRRALLADDMGLGKTIQAIAAAAYLKHMQGLKRALVICPASLKYQWQAEIRRFTKERVEVIGGEPAEREAIYRAAANDSGFIAPEDKPFFYVVNYELVHRDLEKLKALGAELLIVDEAQRVKNFRTKTAQAVFELPAPFVFVLTGTPLENQLMELFTIMRFIDERALGKNPIAFRERYVIQDHFGGVMGYQRVEEVARKIASVTLRRTKEQTLTDLPEMVEVPRWLDLTPVQRTIYQELQGQARQMLKDSVWDGVQSNNALTLLQRLRETCDSAELIDPEKHDSQKVEELLSLLDDEVKSLGRQALVFTQWTRMGEILIRELGGAGFQPAFLHGGIPAVQRPALVERFQAGRDRILVSTDAGGTGLNLQAASLVVNYDMPFNPAKLSQRVARAHRLGQTSTVVVVNLLSRSTVEEKLVRILNEKRELFQDVFGDISDLAQASSQQLNIRELLRELV